MKFPEDVPNLTDGVVTLRAHTGADITGLTEQAADPVMVRWTTVPVPASDDASRFFATEVIPKGWRENSEWQFAVEAEDDDGTPRFAGSVSLRDEGDRRAELAYGAHPWARGRGLIPRALNLLLDWGFEERGLSTVIWLAHEGNWASRRVAWRLGFTFLEGTLPEWLEQRGVLFDAWVGALRASDERTPRTSWLDVPRIVGKRVLLRAHAPGDAVRVQEACADERTVYWLANMPRPYTLGDAERFFHTRRAAQAKGTGLHWAVADPETEALVGNVSIFDIKAGDDAEIGYWTHPDARGRGVMTEACALAIRHAFVAAEDGGLGLRRLKIFAAEGNTSSRHVIESNGFVETGRHRKDTRLGDDTWVDTLTYDLLRSEYAGSPDLR